MEPGRVTCLHSVHSFLFWLFPLKVIKEPNEGDKILTLCLTQSQTENAWTQHFYEFIGLNRISLSKQTNHSDFRMYNFIWILAIGVGYEWQRNWKRKRWTVFAEVTTDRLFHRCNYLKIRSMFRFPNCYSLQSTYTLDLVFHKRTIHTSSNYLWFPRTALKAIGHTGIYVLVPTCTLYTWNEISCNRRFYAFCSQSFLSKMILRNSHRLKRIAFSVGILSCWILYFIFFHLMIDREIKWRRALRTPQLSVFFF